MAVLRVYQMYWHQTQWKYILFEIIGNFNWGIHFVDLVVHFYETKTVLVPSLRFVDTNFSLDFENTSEIKAGDLLCRMLRAKSTDILANIQVHMLSY